MQKLASCDCDVTLCFILAGGALTRLPVVNIMCLCLLPLPEQRAPSSLSGAPAPPLVQPEVFGEVNLPKSWRGGED